MSAHLPILNPFVTFNAFVSSKAASNEEKYIAHCVDTERQSLKEKLNPNQSVTILIGPEGDFSEAEISLARTSGFIPVNLGKSRLRTETAAIVTCHSVSFINV